MLAARGGDAKGLLHETVGLVAVALGLVVVHVFLGTRARVGRLAISSAIWAKATSSLALHFTVGEKATRDSAGAPRLAVGPSTHAGLALIPDEDGARTDGLPLLL